MRYLAWFCFSAAGAVFALQYGLPQTVFVLMLCAAAAVLYGLAQRDRRRLAALILACGIAFGSCYTVVYDLIWIQPAQAYADTEQRVSVTVCAYPQQHTYGAKCEVLLDVGAPVPIRAQLYGNAALMDVKPGDVISTDARLKSAERIREEKITSFTSKGKHLLIYAKGDAVVEEAPSVPVRYLPLYFSRILQERISLVYDGEARILMTALLTGERAEFDDTLYTMLSETGVTHVTAVSGMHCAFLFGMVGLLIKDQRRKALIGIPVLFLFMLMVGSSPSVVRSCFMLALLAVAPLLRRENDTITTMSVALLLILLQNPYAAASISLQLSFLSVLGILLFSKKWYTAMAKRVIKEGSRSAGLWRVFLSALSTTFAASVFTVPLVAYYFECVSLISPLTNLLCLGAVSFSFGVGFVSLLVSVVSLPLAQIVAIPAAAALDYFMAVVRLMMQIPYHAIYTSNAFLPLWLLYFYAMIVLLLARKVKRLRTLLLSAVLAGSTLAFVIVLPVVENGKAEMTISVLDVGQGASLVMTSGAETAVLDCGSNNSWINAGSVAANEVNTLGRTELTYLILTHYHRDHANGLDTLFSRLKVRCLVIPVVEREENRALQEEIIALAQSYGTEILLIDGETLLPFGDAKLTIYPPLGAGNTNEEGLSVLCSYENFDMLVTGDMDGETERSLLDAAALPDLEVLIAGHHGSKYSTDWELLEETTPETAVISVGDNSYGHPALETLRRLYENNVETYRTDENGTVTMYVY